MSFFRNYNHTEGPGQTSVTVPFDDFMSTPAAIREVQRDYDADAQTVQRPAIFGATNLGDLYDNITDAQADIAIPNTSFYVPTTYEDDERTESEAKEHFAASKKFKATGLGEIWQENNQAVAPFHRLPRFATNNA